MADGGGAGQSADDLFLAEALADVAERPVGVELAAVEGDDAGCLLAAMLQRVQPERGQRRGVGLSEDAEDATFLVWLIVAE